MAFTIGWLDHGIWVGGYANDDWISVPTGGRVVKAGLAGAAASAAHGWAVTGPRNGFGDSREVVLLDLVNRRRIGSVNFASIMGDAVLASRDGTRLYVPSNRHEGASRRPDYKFLGVEIAVIDARSGAVRDRHLIECAYSSLYQQWMAETIDGMIRLPVQLKPPGQDQAEQAVATLDPATGRVMFMPLPHGAHFLWLSPQGRLALRPDMASIATRNEPKRLFGFIPVGPPTRYFGLGMQLWSIDPVRYVRTIPVAWFTYGELPDNGYRQAKRSAYDRIMAACAALGPDEHGPPELTANPYPEEPDRQIVARIHRQFAEDLPGPVVWNDDERSFWTRVHGYWSWADVEGRASPRLALARTGMKPGMVVPYADGPQRVTPQAGREALFEFRQFHGGVCRATATVTAPVPRVFRATQMIARTVDGWRESGFDIRAAMGRVQNALGAMRTVDIALGDLSAESVVKAITALDRDLRSSIEAAMAENTVEFRFGGKALALAEDDFFARVEREVPEAAAPLRSLIGNVVSGRGVPAGLGDLPFSNGWQLLGPAVKALGVLDPSSLPLVAHYGRLLDQEHEYYFAQTTIPAVIAAHSWQPPVVAFGIDVILAGFSIASTLWRDWGMGAAVAASQTPRDFAAALIEAIAREEEPEEPGDLQHPTLDGLKKGIAPLTPWEEELFTHLV